MATRLMNPMLEADIEEAQACEGNGDFLRATTALGRVWRDMQSEELPTQVDYLVSCCRVANQAVLAAMMDGDERVPLAENLLKLAWQRLEELEKNLRKDCSSDLALLTGSLRTGFPSDTALQIPGSFSGLAVSFSPLTLSASSPSSNFLN